MKLHLQAPRGREVGLCGLVPPHQQLLLRGREQGQPSQGGAGVSAVRRRLRQRGDVARHPLHAARGEERPAAVDHSGPRLQAQAQLRLSFTVAPAFRRPRRLHLRTEAQLGAAALGGGGRRRLGLLLLLIITATPILLLRPPLLLRLLQSRQLLHPLAHVAQQLQEGPLTFELQLHNTKAAPHVAPDAQLELLTPAQQGKRQERQQQLWEGGRWPSSLRMLLLLLLHPLQHAL